MPETFRKPSRLRTMLTNSTQLSGGRNGVWSYLIIYCRCGNLRTFSPTDAERDKGQLRRLLPQWETWLGPATDWLPSRCLKHIQVERKLPARATAAKCTVGPH